MSLTLLEIIISFAGGILLDRLYLAPELRKLRDNNTIAQIRAVRDFAHRFKYLLQKREESNIGPLDEKEIDKCEAEFSDFSSTFNTHRHWFLNVDMGPNEENLSTRNIEFMEQIIVEANKSIALIQENGSDKAKKMIEGTYRTPREVLVACLIGVAIGLIIGNLYILLFP